jgi:hypothetical protein
MGMRALTLVVLLFCGLRSSAQFELGASLGAFDSRIEGRSSEGHARAYLFAYGGPFPTAAIHYCERRGSHASMGFEMAWVRREFQAEYSNGGLGSQSGKDMDVRLDLLYFGILPEVRMGARSTAVVRFGLQGGFLIDSRMRGRQWSVGGLPATSLYDEWYEGSANADFGGDVRAIFGFGFQLPMNERCIMVFDPYFSGSITSLLKQEPGSRGVDFGIRIGLARAFSTNCLTVLLEKDRAERQ